MMRLRLMQAAALIAGAGLGLFLLTPGQKSMTTFKERTPRPAELAAREVEEEEEEEGELRQDEPNAYLEYQLAIRTREGESVPGYAMGYRSTEILKARASSKLMKTTALPWVCGGPGNVGGRTRALVVDPDDPTRQTWYVGSVSGGVWKTTNGGGSWVDKTPGLANLATTVLVMASSDHNCLYIGTGEGVSNIDAVKGDGIWKSTDRGETWTQIAATASNSNFAYVNRIIVDPSNSSVLVVATNNGIYRTVNAGGAWTTVFSSPTYKIQQVLADPANFSIQYASQNSIGVLKSTDSGVTWFADTVGLGRVGRRYELAIAPSNTSRIYASVEMASGIGELYLSTDAGATWKRAVDLSAQPANWLGSQGWYDNAIVVHPYNADIVFVAGLDIYKAVVGSAATSPTRAMTRLTSWTGTGAPYVHADHHAFATIPINASTQEFRILNGSDGGIAVSNNGGVSWTNPNLGYVTSQFYGVDKRHGMDQYIGGTQDNGTWISPVNPTAATSWNSAIGGDGFAAAWHYTDPSLVIGTLYYNMLYVSTDGGSSFASSVKDLGDIGSGKGPFITHVAKSNSDPNLLFAIGSSGIWRSDDFSESWTKSTIVSGTWGALSSRGKAAISIANPKIVWAGGRMSSTGNVLVSIDGGLTFRTTVNSMSLGTLSGLTTHPVKDSTAYALFSIAKAPKILKTTNLGQSWTDLSGFGTGTVSTNGFPDVAVYSLLVMPYDTRILWAGTEIGLFVSTDEGAAWTYSNNGLPAVAIWQMSIVDDKVVVATHGRGIWSVALPQLASYTPPVSTLQPRLGAMAQGPSGSLKISVSLRSAYDSSTIMINGQPVLRMAGNTAPRDTSLYYPVMKAESLRVYVDAYRNSEEFLSVTRTVSVQLPQAPRASYSDNFESSNSYFAASGFSRQTASGFSGTAYHTAHPYADMTSSTLLLTIPIVVASSNAFVRFDEVALVEPGEAGSQFGDADFYDYCVVEGTKDGMAWIPLEAGYDCRAYAEWLDAWNSNSSGTSSLLRKRTLNLLNKFSPGDVVFLRFRMYADEGAHGWGWVIDNLEIQESFTSVPNDQPTPPESFNLAQNYPNPFNPTTTIAFSIARSSHVTLRIYDALGRQVAELVSGQKAPGWYHVTWNGSAVPSGAYFYRLEAGGYSRTRKLMLVK